MKLRSLLLLLFVLAAAGAAAGCGAVGRVTSGDASHGKELFLKPAKPGAPSCSSCHALADAGSTATIGPNLDDAFGSDRQQGWHEQDFRDIVRGQIAYPDPSGPMPADLYRGQDASDVAVYVAKCAANPTCGVQATGQQTTTTTPSAPGGKVDGKQVFTTAGCSGCHTLKDAGATGNVGPNLDQLKPPEAIVEHQVINGGGAMPAFKGQLSAAQIKAVATYVSSVAGK